MKVLCDFNLVSIGSGTSISKFIVECHKILNQYNLKTHIHAFGTNIEGEWEQISEAIEKCHKRLHEMGAIRLLSTLKLSTRIDRDQNIHEKINSVKKYL